MLEAQREGEPRRQRPRRAVCLRQIDRPGLYAAGSVTALADDLGEAFRDEYTRSAILPRRAAAAAMQAPVERRLPEEAASQAE